MSDSKSKFDTIRLMDNPNPLIRLSIFGRLKKMIKGYQGTKIETIDRRILRGLYLRNLKDFDEKIIDEMSNISLLERLKYDFLRLKSLKDKRVSTIMDSQSSFTPVNITKYRDLVRRDDSLVLEDEEFFYNDQDFTKMR